MKATQGDGGWAQMDMVADVYSHILDEDRKIGAQKVEAALYSNPDLQTVKAPAKEPELELETLLNQLKKRPELASALAGLLNDSALGQTEK